MKGWKTWCGVVLAMTTAGLEAAGYWELSKVVGTIAGGMAAWGIGHKLDKTREGTK